MRFSDDDFLPNNIMPHQANMLPRVAVAPPMPRAAAYEEEENFDMSGLFD